MNGPLAALLALSLTATAGPRGDAPWLADAASTGRVSTATVAAEDPAAAVAQARAELAEIRSLLDSAATQRDRRRIAIKLARLDQTLASADNAIAQKARAAWGRGYRPSPTIPKPRARVHDDDDDDDDDDDERVQRRPHKPSPRAMSAASFASFQAQVERASFASDRLRLIESAARHRYFTAAQVGQLVESMPFGAEKVEAGVILFPRTLDKGNWHVVYDGFDFRVDARNLARRVATM
jgi:hypothetical protein